MRSAPVLLILIACGGSSGSTWDEGVDDFIEAICFEYEPCTNEEPQDCEADVRTDLAQARDELDEAGEAACLECLATKAEVARGTAATCQLDSDDTAAILAACDTDPANDFDGDGTPDNDDDEACAGFP